MKSIQRINVYSPPLKATSFCLALAVMGSFCISSAAAQAVFGDGKTHFVSDATYEFTRIEVVNGTTLVIQDGAVIAAPIAPLYEFASGLPVLRFSGAAIQAFDKSMVIVQGGEFGGDRTNTPGCVDPFCVAPFADNWYSGSIAAFDQAKVIIEDGSFGSCAFRSGTTAVFDDAKLIVSGGTFTQPGGTNAQGLGCQAGGGRIELWDDSQANISGGLQGSSINQEGPVNNSTLNVSGGIFGRENAGPPPLVNRGAIHADGTATVRISGGEFGGAGLVFLNGVVDLRGAATAKISGGTFSGAPGTGNGLVSVLSEDAHVTISGGQFSSALNVTAGQMTVEGCEFNLPFGPVDALSGDLLGFLASGDVINVVFTRADSPDAVIDLVEEPCD